MAMKKSIGRTLAHIDVAANTSVRIHEDFFNTHPDSHHPSQNAAGPRLEDEDKERPSILMLQDPLHVPLPTKPRTARNRPN